MTDTPTPVPAASERMTAEPLGEDLMLQAFADYIARYTKGKGII